MKYKNTETGFVFESKSEIKAEGWVQLDPQPKAETKTSDAKPKRTKRIK